MGKYNVTEAAMEVGYSSLSHFSQSFCETMGRCPGLYPLKAGGSEPPCTPKARRNRIREQSTAKESQYAGSADS